MSVFGSCLFESFQQLCNFKKNGFLFPFFSSFLTSALFRPVVLNLFWFAAPSLSYVDIWRLDGQMGIKIKELNWLAAPLAPAHGILVYRGTPVGNHCLRLHGGGRGLSNKQTNKHKQNKTKNFFLLQRQAMFFFKLQSHSKVSVLTKVGVHFSPSLKVGSFYIIYCLS